MLVESVDKLGGHQSTRALESAFTFMSSCARPCPLVLFHPLGYVKSASVEHNMPRQMGTAKSM